MIAVTVGSTPADFLECYKGNMNVVRRSKPNGLVKGLCYSNIMLKYVDQNNIFGDLENSLHL